MADVYCHNCGEPWDTYGLRHEIVWETDLPKQVQEHFNGKLPTNPNSRTHNAFRNAGWEFGSTVFNIKRCPCCRANAAERNQDNDEYGILRARIMRDRSLHADVIEEMLGDDLDAIQIEIEDLAD
jgi:hypothetical protein